MILVVADTTPLRYLVEIGYEHLLPRLFMKVWIPGAVVAELRQQRTPATVRQWAERLPSWIEVRIVEGSPSEHELAGLDRGEWEAIELARTIHANLLLIDERTGARVARAQGFTVTGTLGVLVEAARSGLVSIEEVLERLAKTNFRGTPDLFAQAQKLARKGPGEEVGNE
jgi:predicted nucleic acid-binding protein